jgi:hypothetical protein
MRRASLFARIEHRIEYLTEHLETRSKLIVAGIALEDALVAGPGTSGAKGRDCLMLNPATGALEAGFAHREKVPEALMRELHGMKLRLYLAFAGLYFEKFLLQCGGAALRILREADCYFVYLVVKRHRLAQDIEVQARPGMGRPQFSSLITHAQASSVCTAHWSFVIG